MSSVPSPIDTDIEEPHSDWDRCLTMLGSLDSTSTYPILDSNMYLPSNASPFWNEILAASTDASSAVNIFSMDATSTETEEESSSGMFLSSAEGAIGTTCTSHTPAVMAACGSVRSSNSSNSSNSSSASSSSNSSTTGTGTCSNSGSVASNYNTNTNTDTNTGRETLSAPPKRARGRPRKHNPYADADIHIDAPSSSTTSSSSSPATGVVYASEASLFSTGSSAAVAAAAAVIGEVLPKRRPFRSTAQRVVPSEDRPSIHTDDSNGGASNNNRQSSRRTRKPTGSASSSSSIVASASVSSSITGRRKASDAARSILFDWLHEHRDNPYPSRAQKSQLAAHTGLTIAQVVHWMSNIRKRRLIPLLSGKRAPSSNVDRKFLDEMADRQHRI
mmetsp:Transcript_32487/g.54348  ORF Transcript_32487/g.54348 Transcript_32487/m.54348 type:complete len:389 (+) Transcript_32487:343-1509(+)